jgi:PAS domain S-box-containing protein
MQFAYIGRQIESLLGWSQDSWQTAEDWMTRIHPEDRDYVVNFCIGQSKDGLDHAADYRALTKSNSYVWIRDVVHVVRDAQGNIDSLIGFMFDISERKSAHLTGNTTQAQPAGSGHRRNHDQMAELHAYLIQLEGGIPTLDELGSRFNRSARWLNEDFAKEYGQTIYAFMVDHRLKQAHSDLSAGNLPIKAISMRLGYSNVSNFSAAFKTKFGYPPAQLRRNHTTQG